MQPITQHGKTIVELKNISFAYGDETILDNFNFEIHRGDYIGIIGPNGGGKTTLLKIMLGLLPARGEVRLFETDIKNFKDWQKIAYVSQLATHIDTGFPIAVEEVVRMGRYANKGAFRCLDAKDAEKITRALREVNMEEYRHRLVGELSGGQQQRVFIARALSGEPEIIVLDEPTIGVDVEQQERFYSLLRKLNRELHITLILVTHDLALAEEEATELICLNKTLTYCGLPNEFRAHKNFHGIFTKGVHNHEHHL